MGAQVGFIRSLPSREGHSRLDRVKTLLTIGCSLWLLVVSCIPTFAADVSVYGAGIIPESIKATDLNRDGNLDIVVTNYFAVGSVSVLLGNGDGTLGSAATYYLPGNAENPSYVAVNDIDKDMKPDLIVAGDLCSSFGCSAGVIVLRGNGNGTFQWVSSYAFPSSHAASIAVADFDQDSNDDVAVGLGNGRIAFLQGNGLGAFQAAGSYDSGSVGAISVALGDFNKDGRVDVAATGDGDGVMGILSGNGDGTFQLVGTYSTEAHRPGIWGGYSFLVAVGDIDADSNLDLVTANGCAQSITQCNGVVAALRGNGNGTFQQAKQYSSGGWLSTSVALGDFDADGAMDVAVSNECSNKQCRYGTVGVLLGDRVRLLQDPKRYSSGGWVATSVTVGDFNEDGRLDLVAANFCAAENDCASGTVRVLIGNGDGTFAPK